MKIESGRAAFTQSSNVCILNGTGKGKFMDNLLTRVEFFLDRKAALADASP